jgi:hypothetical protein
VVAGAKPKAGRDTNERGASDEEEEEESDEGEDEIGEQAAVVLRRHHGAKRRQDSSQELALEQHAGASKRLRPAAKKANLWTLDAHLHYLSIWLEYLNTYKYLLHHISDRRLLCCC